jgi:hypothetical protein
MRPFSIPPRLALLIVMLAALLFSGCSDALQDAVAGRGTGFLDYLLFCSTFNICF